MSKGTFTYRPEMWDARLKVFREVFPWILEELKVMAGLKADTEIGSEATIDENKAFLRVDDEYNLGTRSNDERIVALHRRQNAEWERLTGLAPLGTDDDWQKAGIAAGAPAKAIESVDIERLAKYITVWTMTLTKEQSKQKEDEIQPGKLSKAESPAERAALFGVSARVFVKSCEEGKIRHKKLSSKSYQVHVDDMPTTKRQ